MSERAQDLGRRLKAFNEQLIDFVERCSDRNWGAVCSPEDWSVGVTARHIAAGHFEVLALARMIVAGEELPEITADQLTSMANEHALAHAGCGRDEVLQLLRKNGAALAEFASSLEDSELDRSAYLATTGSEVTTQQVIELVVLGSGGEHLAHMKEAAGR